MKEEKTHRCVKCGWVWKPKNPDKTPVACPYCKSYKWQEINPAITAYNRGS